MPSIHFSPEAPLNVSKLKLCVKCKHFIPPVAKPQKGHCRLYGNADVIDGTVKHADVWVTREQYCKGVHYEEKSST